MDLKVYGYKWVEDPRKLEHYLEKNGQVLINPKGKIVGQVHAMSGVWYSRHLDKFLGNYISEKTGKLAVEEEESLTLRTPTP